MYPTGQLAAEMLVQGSALGAALPANEAALATARRVLAGSRRVCFVGIGSSRHVATYGASCLEALHRVPCSLLPSPGYGIPLPSLSRDDMLVVVSQSGGTPALMPLVETATAAGTFIVTVTNVPGSPLEHYALVALHTHAGIEQVVPATKSVTVSMLLLRALAGPVDAESVAHLSEVVTGLGTGEALGRHASGLGLPLAVVGGGFAAEAVADEVALKVAEVAGHLAVAENAVDYLHGPVVVPGPVLALLEGNDPNMRAVLDRPQVLSVGQHKGRDVHLPSTGERTLDAIALVVAGQWLALHWALGRGLDPDDARGLQKVTLTR